MCLAVPMKIIEIKGVEATAETSGVARRINLGIMEGVKVGDYVMVHAGFAIEKVDRKRAEETLEILYEIRRRVSE